MTRVLMIVFLLMVTEKVVRAQIVAANAADLSSRLAPGSIGILVYGEFGVTGTFDAASLPLPTTLGGVSVEIGGHLAPLFSVSPVLIKFQVPEGVTPGQLAIVVTRPDGNKLYSSAYIARHGPAIAQEKSGMMDMSEKSGPNLHCMVPVVSGPAPHFHLNFV